MTKLTITKKTGSVDTLNLMSAFKVENNIYVVLDSEKTGSMGLPIIYVSKLTDHLEKIVDDNEWQSVKNYLKGIINGTNFEYVTINPNESADEAYYKELSLPNIDSFNAIKNRYLPQDNPSSTSNEGVAPNPVPNAVETMASVSPIPTISNPEPIGSPEAPSVPIINEPQVNVAPTTPIMPSAPEISKTPQVETTMQVEETPQVENSIEIDFSADKETFLKACENMFDALISKYQKELMNLNEREKEIKKKEQEIAIKMANATEHLANAEAKEQVANIAHDNAKRVMDLNNLMPTNPEGVNN